MKNKFILYLENSYSTGNLIVGRYRFVKWLKNGNFQYEINTNNKKSISRDLLKLAYQTHIDKPSFKFTYKWVKSHNHDNWCTPTVLEALFKKYDVYLSNNEL